VGGETDQWRVLVLVVFNSGMLVYQKVTVGINIAALCYCAVHMTVIKLRVARKFLVPEDYKSVSILWANKIQGRNIADSTKFTIHLPVRGCICDTSSVVK
jgi:hypothetical protein